MESQYKSELGTLYAYMERVANSESMPVRKFRDLTPSQETVKEYEIKTKNLRVYLIKRKGGKIVVLGGYKNTQKNDLRKFRSLKKQYLQSISG